MWKHVTALGFFATSAVASTPMDTPAEVVRQFYTWRIHSDMAGSPTMAQLDAMRGWLTPELACLVQATRKFDDFATARYHNNIKPLFAEGDLFSGAFITPPDRFDIEDTQTQSNSAAIRVRIYPNAEYSGGESWPVTIYLRKTSTQWKISDVQYPAEFASGNPKLTDVLLTKALYNAMSHDSPDGWKAANVLDCRKKYSLSK